MSWWWVEGRRKYKNPLKKNGKPKKEKWDRMYCARDEQGAKLLIRQIKHSVAAGKQGTKDSKSHDREIDILSRYDEWRVITPELPPVKGKRSRKTAEISERTQPSGLREVECPGCGVRGAKKVKKGDKKLWKCPSCGRRWPRSPGNGSQKPSKGLEAKSATPVAQERPRKRQKPARDRG